MAVETDKWKQTYTGKKFDLLNPDPEMICIEDIAHSLSMLCRFNGHVEHFYSVAEHSIMMASVVHPKYRLHALLHDATEAYIGDIISPVKQVIPELYDIETPIAQVIYQAFGLTWDLDSLAAIKEADRRLLITERNQLMGTPPEPWFCEGYEPYDMELPCYFPGSAKRVFLDFFKLLTGDGDSRRFLLNLKSQKETDK